jgi:predicted PurR-regulated permease PerM
MASMVVFALNPAVRWCAAHGLPRRFAATLVFAVAVVATALLLELLVPVVVTQAQDLARSSPALVRQGGGLISRLSNSSNAALRPLGEAASRWIQDHAGNAPKELATLGGAGLQLAHAGLILILGGFLGFLLLLSLPEASRGTLALIPPAYREEVEGPLMEARRIVGGYVRARLLVSAAVGVLATIGLWAIHMPFWLLLGMVVGVANLIPMFGSWIGAIPVAMVSLATKPPSFLLVVLVVVVLAHAIDGYVLSPLVLKQTTDLHPVVTLLAVLIGAELLGFWGILAAIPVAGIIQLALREWVVPHLTGRPPPSQARAAAAEAG